MQILSGGRSSGSGSARGEPQRARRRRALAEVGERHEMLEEARRRHRGAVRRRWDDQLPRAAFRGRLRRALRPARRACADRHRRLRAGLVPAGRSARGRDDRGGARDGAGPAVRRSRRRWQAAHRPDRRRWTPIVMRRSGARIELHRWFGLGWKVNADLPNPAAFAGAGAVRDTRGRGRGDRLRAGSAGARRRHQALPRRRPKVALLQIGADTQADFCAWAERELLPALRALWHSPQLHRRSVCFDAAMAADEHDDDHGRLTRRQALRAGAGACAGGAAMLGLLGRRGAGRRARRPARALRPHRGRPGRAERDPDRHRLDARGLPRRVRQHARADAEPRRAREATGYVRRGARRRCRPGRRATRCSPATAQFPFRDWRRRRRSCRRTPAGARSRGPADVPEVLDRAGVRPPT